MDTAPAAVAVAAELRRIQFADRMFAAVAVAVAEHTEESRAYLRPSSQQEVRIAGAMLAWPIGFRG